MSPEDQRYIEGIKARDEVIIRELYQETRDYISASIRKHSLIPPEDVQIIFHDALLKLIEKIQDPGFELRSRLRSFLFGIARNFWMKELERRKIQSSRLKLIMNDPISGLRNEDHVYIQEMVEGIDCKGKIKGILLQLEKRDLDILRAYYIEKKRLSEIDKEIGMGESYASQRKFKIIKRLRKWVDEDVQFEKCLAEFGIELP